MDSAPVPQPGVTQNPSTNPTSKSTAQHKKHSRLPPTHKISKRPLLHPAISSPYSHTTHSQKIIYISHSTPFIATIKRTQKYLLAIQNRTTQSSTTLLSSSLRKPHPNQKHKNKIENLRTLLQEGNDAEFLKKVERDVVQQEREDEEEVVLKATGKAIERLIGVAAWFIAEEGGAKYKVEIRTGSVGTVDDVVARGSEEGSANVDVEESRIRRVSCLEVGVKLR
ncbi:Rpp20 subunit of nuclear RNase MRP and P-domain-containing protein [Tricladium varicosporioides]|nr:Rpp20 subunit of nuclear RNase MRP and P-domain-containing protein [Hymenoscyphus varicosporioides]